MIDLTIICKLLRKLLPNFYQKIKQIKGEELIVRNILMKLVLSLFTHIENKEVFESIWDCFFLDGSIAFFYISIIFFKTASENKEVLEYLSQATQNLNDNSMNEIISSSIEKLCLNYKDVEKMKYFLFSFDFGINSSNINYWRRLSHQSNDSNGGDKSSMRRKNTYIQKEECDLDWPICLYDRSYRFKKVEFIVYKTGKPKEVIDDYYFNGCLDDVKFREFLSKNNIPEIKKELPLGNDEDDEVRHLKEQIKSYENLVIERFKHICGSSKTTKKMVFEKLLSIEDKKAKMNKVLLSKQKAEIMIDQFIQITNEKNMKKTQSKEIEVNMQLDLNIENNIKPELVAKTSDMLKDNKE